MLAKLKQLARTIKQELAFYRMLSQHKETPLSAKLLLGLALGYLLLPFDLIPDFIPLLGQLDDVVIIPLLIYWALKLTPEEVINICRENVK
jgi:uncharacterized membrane protein YkvA (DUF1232 family)